jgi:hypothetical protein
VRARGRLALGTAAQVVAPAARRAGLRREHLVVLFAGQRGAHPLVGVRALGRDILSPPEVPPEGLIGVLPGEHLPRRQVVQLNAAAVTAQRAGGGERVDRQCERTARVIHGQQVAAGLVVNDDELGAFLVIQARPGIEPVDPSRDRYLVGPRRHRALHADGLVGRVEPADVPLHEGSRPVPVAGRLRVAREPLTDPALDQQRARGLRRAPGQRQPPPGRQGIMDGRANAVVRPRRPFRRGWPVQVAHPVLAGTVEPGREPGRRTRVKPPRHSLETELLHCHDWKRPFLFALTTQVTEPSNIKKKGSLRTPRAGRPPPSRRTAWRRRRSCSPRRGQAARGSPGAGRGAARRSR